jgi:glucose/arabinose dehydrogenase
MRAAVAAFVVFAAAATPAQAAPRLVPLGEFESPVHVTGSPQDSHRMFVVEQPGRVQVVVDGRRQAQPFLDVSGITLAGGERGLLSIAFPPDYQTSRRFYVYLTARSPVGQIQVREYLRAAADPNRADPTTGRTVLAIDHSRFANHNGGQLQFGPDGRLWIGTGDGGGSNDPDNNAQDRSSRLGKVLRLDPLASGAPEIFAIGLRNPWRFSFDRQGGDLVIADVGQQAFEEISVAPAPTWRPGANYGWPCWEGTRKNTEADPPCDPPDDVQPVHVRSHDADGVCSITGGYVVRDPGLPTLYGRYLYGDFCVQGLRSLVLSDAATDAPAGLSVPSTTSFGEDVCGRIYVASRNGPVHRIQDGAPTACAVDPPGGTAPPPPPPPPAAAVEDTPPPPPPPPAAAVEDTPSLRIAVRGRKSLASRRRLRVALVSDENVAARISGRLLGVARFRTRRLDLAAGQRRVVNLRLGRRNARELRRTLRRKRVIAKVSVRVADAAGNARSRERRLVVPRRR